MVRTTERLQTRLKWWTWQEHQTERWRRVLHITPLLGLILAAAAGRVHPLLGGGLIAASILTWLLGLSGSAKKRAWLASEIRRAEGGLRRARGQSDVLH